MNYQDRNFLVKMQQKHDTENNWAAHSDYKPLAGEIVVYDAEDKTSSPRIKIGNGEKNVMELPFFADLSEINSEIDQIKEEISGRPIFQFIYNLTASDQTNLSFDSVATNGKTLYVGDLILSANGRIHKITSINRENLNFNTKFIYNINGSSIYSWYNRSNDNEEDESISRETFDSNGKYVDVNDLLIDPKGRIFKVMSLETKSDSGKEFFNVSYVTSLPSGPKGEKGDQGPPGYIQFEELKPEEKEQLKGDTGPQGEQGEPFTYDKFTQEQLEALRGPQGVQGPQGEPFRIAKVFSSFEEMKQGISSPSINEGDFVIISGDDSYNGSIYVKKGSSYFSLITKISGSQGLQGPAGPQGLKGDQGEIGYSIYKYTGTVVTDTAYASPEEFETNGRVLRVGDFALNKSNTLYSIKDTNVQNNGSRTIKMSKYVSLKGEKGDQGDKGDKGTTGNSIFWLKFNLKKSVEYDIKNFSFGTNFIEAGEREVSVNDLLISTDGYLLEVTDSGNKPRITDYYLSHYADMENIPGYSPDHQHQGWSTSIPTYVSSDMYLWNYQEISFSSDPNDEKILTTPKILAQGRGKEKTIQAINSYYMVRSSIDILNYIEQANVVPTVTKNRNELYVRKLIMYSDLAGMELTNYSWIYDYNPDRDYIFSKYLYKLTTDGESIKITDIQESLDDTKDNIITFSDGSLIHIRNGKNIGVKEYQESFDDYGENIITFTNDEKIIIRNGRKGQDGTVSFDELTETQRLSLKGEKGDVGPSGVYLGTFEPGEEYDVWIDPLGDYESEEDSNIHASNNIILGNTKGIYFKNSNGDLKSVLKVTNQDQIVIGENEGHLETVICTTLRPNGAQSKSIDLGGLDAYWKDLYLSGKLTDGINSISVANLTSHIGNSTVHITNDERNSWNKKVDDFTFEIYNGTSENPKPVKFASFNYSTCDTENGIAAKISLVSGHGNGSSYAFLEDAILKVTNQGVVTVDNFKYYGASTGTYDGASRQYGDIFWVNDTTNKIVDFYCLMGQYARMYQTPWKRLTYSSKGTVTQYTSANVYSEGEKVWANNSDIALRSDIPAKTETLNITYEDGSTRALEVYVK